MNKIIIFILCLLPFWVDAQDSLNLKGCHTKAIENYPLIKQRDLLDKITSEKIKSLKTANLPQVNLNGQASYQSDVTEIPIKVPLISLPEVDKDIYKITLDMNQLIWDGGTLSKQKELEKISLKTDQQSLDVELYKIKDRVNQIYFSILTLQKNTEILQAVLDDLKQKQSRMESGVNNGIVLESQLDVLKAERLKVEQQIAELEISKQSGMEMLGEFTGQRYPINQGLAVPALGDINPGSQHGRLEPLVFDLQAQKLDVSKQLAGTRYMPKIYGFAQAGYGKPGLNMLNNEFDNFWMVGAKFSWNIWNWHQLKNDRQVMDFQKEILVTQKETFDKNLAISLENQMAQVKKYEVMLEKDEEIIALRNKVTKASASQLENGIITSSDYITELNNETQARLNKENHKIFLVKAKVDYLTIKGVL